MSSVIPHTMENAYRELYSRVRETVANKDNKLPSILSSFFPMKGTGFNNAGIRLMVVGRSTNGWKRFDFTQKTEEDFVNEVKSAITSDNGFSQWLYPNGQAKECIIRTVKDRKRVVDVTEDVYTNLQDVAVFKQNLKKVGLEMYQWHISQFFYSTRNALESLCRANRISLDNGKAWFENIVWTNICPISPVDEGDANAGNATGLLKEIQLSMCGKLLTEQIHYFKPTNILFFTGWKQGDEPAFNDVQSSFPNVQHCEEDDRIVGKGVYNGIPVVVAVYPLFKGNFTEKVQEAFMELKR